MTVVCFPHSVRYTGSQGALKNGTFPPWWGEMEYIIYNLIMTWCLVSVMIIITSKDMDKGTLAEYDWFLPQIIYFSRLEYPKCSNKASFMKFYKNVGDFHLCLFCIIHVGSFLSCPNNTFSVSFGGSLARAESVLFLSAWNALTFIFQGVFYWV